MKWLILVLLLVATCTRAKYEDGYRGGSRRPHFEDSLEESDESLESDEQNRYERQYNYESHESYENDVEEPKVTFSKRKLHQYIEEEDKFFDDVKQDNRQSSEHHKDNRQPAEHHKDNRQPAEHHKDNRQPAEPHKDNRQPVDHHKDNYYQENRYVQPRDEQHQEERYPNNKYNQHKYPDRKDTDDRYPEKRYRGEKYADNKDKDEKYPYKKHRDEKYMKYRADKKYQAGEEVKFKVEHYHGDGGYTWKQDREQWAPISPLNYEPAEKPHKTTTEQPQPPTPSEAALMARYIVHNSDWTTVSTISTLPKIRNYPFVNVLSVSDGPSGAGTGIPYLYMTELDLTPHDLAADRRCSISMSLAETDYCKQQNLDPEDPRCARITLTGEMWRLKNGTQAAKTAEEAIFSRHPAMRNWPKDHHFFFATLKIEHIVLLDYFGGPKFISVTDYLRAKPYN